LLLSGDEPSKYVIDALKAIAELTPPPNPQYFSIKFAVRWEESGGGSTFKRGEGEQWLLAAAAWVKVFRVKI
jgi:hypothetical protein